MIKGDDDAIILQATKETINDLIVLTEGKEYDGRLFNEDIKYHLIHLNTEKADCKDNC